MSKKRSSSQHGKRPSAKTRGRARLVPPAQRGYAQRKRRFSEDAMQDTGEGAR